MYITSDSVDCYCMCAYCVAISVHIASPYVNHIQPCIGLVQILIDGQLPLWLYELIVLLLSALVQGIELCVQFCVHVHVYIYVCNALGMQLLLQFLTVHVCGTCFSILHQDTVCSCM